MKLYAKVMGNGAPLLILHGVFGSGDNWQTLGRKWAEHFEVHLLDARNHGKSPHSDQFSYDLMSDDLLDYMEQNQLSKARIIGHSMGGKTAMLFAVLNPEKVQKLVIADIAPKPYKPHHQKIIAALQALDLSNIGSRGEAEDQFAPGIEEEGVRQFLLKSLYWKEKVVLDWRFNVPVIAREIEKVGDPLPANAVFNGPVLFVRGGQSWYIGEEDREVIRDHFPEARLETVERAGHWLHAEQPKAFFEVVQAFLRD